MPIRNLDDLFLTELQETYAAEKLIVGPLAQLVIAKADTSTSYITRSHNRIDRLENVFGLLGREPDIGKRPPMGGMLAELDELIGSDPTTSNYAAAVRSVVETVRHYMMARYVTLSSWANELGMPQVSELMAVTLEEERGSSRMPAAAEREQDNGKGISLGERLTAMFDRKR
jgi:ferritin-like metal-binding protein YciE